MVKHSDNLLEFIEHLNDFGKNGKNSNLDIIHEESVHEFWQNDNSFIEIDNARQSSDTTLKEFALSLNDNYVIVDLRSKPNKSGFEWGRFMGNLQNTVRYNSEFLWAFDSSLKKGFWSKLFGG